MPFLAKSSHPPGMFHPAVKITAKVNVHTYKSLQRTPITLRFMVVAEILCCESSNFRCARPLRVERLAGLQDSVSEMNKLTSRRPDAVDCQEVCSLHGSDNVTMLTIAEP